MSIIPCMLWRRGVLLKLQVIKITLHVKYDICSHKNVHKILEQKLALMGFTELFGPHKTLIKGKWKLPKTFIFVMCKLWIC